MTQAFASQTKNIFLRTYVCNLQQYHDSPLMSMFHMTEIPCTEHLNETQPGFGCFNLESAITFNYSCCHMRTSPRSHLIHSDAHAKLFSQLTHLKITC